MPGYYETMMQQMMPLARLGMQDRQQDFANQLRMQQLMRQYEQMGAQERYRSEMLRNQGVNQNRMLLQLQEQLRANAARERVQEGNLKARERAVDMPHFGPPMEMQTETGDPLSVLPDSKTGRLFDPVQQRWIGRPTGQPQPMAGGGEETPMLRRPLPVPPGDRRNLLGLGQNIQDVVALTKSFKNDYAGSILPIIGEAENVIRQYAPGVNADQPNWWRQYRRMSEILERHKAFGGALTAGEQALWARAEINPGMKPGDIKKMLNVRIALLRQAMNRSMQALGPRYNRKEIENAAGFDFPTQRLNQMPSLEDLATQGSEISGVGKPPPLEELLR